MLSIGLGVFGQDTKLDQLLKVAPRPVLRTLGFHSSTGSGNKQVLLCQAPSQPLHWLEFGSSQSTSHEVCCWDPQSRDGRSHKSAAQPVRDRAPSTWSCSHCCCWEDTYHLFSSSHLLKGQNKMCQEADWRVHTHLSLRD